MLLQQVGEGVHGRQELAGRLLAGSGALYGTDGSRHVGGREQPLGEPGELAGEGREGALTR